MEIKIHVKITGLTKDESELFDRNIFGQFSVTPTVSGDVNYDNMSCGLAAIYQGLAKNTKHPELFTQIWLDAPFLDKLARHIPTEE